MQRRQQFGRRTAPEREPPRVRAAAAAPKPAETLQPVAEHLDLYAGDTALEHELKEWKAGRKVRKRSFREPWRSFSIAAGLAFAVGPFILPDSVADIANYLTLGLCAASVFAGLRKPRN